MLSLQQAPLPAMAGARVCHGFPTTISVNVPPYRSKSLNARGACRTGISFCSQFLVPLRVTSRMARSINRRPVVVRCRTQQESKLADQRPGRRSLQGCCEWEETDDDKITLRIFPQHSRNTEDIPWIISGADVKTLQDLADILCTYAAATVVIRRRPLHQNPVVALLSALFSFFLRLGKPLAALGRFVLSHLPMPEHCVPNADAPLRVKTVLMPKALTADLLDKVPEEETAPLKRRQLRDIWPNYLQVGVEGTQSKSRESIKRKNKKTEQVLIDQHVVAHRLVIDQRRSRLQVAQGSILVEKNVCNIPLTHAQLVDFSLEIEAYLADHDLPLGRVKQLPPSLRQFHDTSPFGATVKQIVKLLGGVILATAVAFAVRSLSKEAFPNVHSPSQETLSISVEQKMGSKKAPVSIFSMKEQSDRNPIDGLTEEENKAFYKELRAVEELFLRVAREGQIIYWSDETDDVLKKARGRLGSLEGYTSVGRQASVMNPQQIGDFCSRLVENLRTYSFSSNLDSTATLQRNKWGAWIGADLTGLVTLDELLDVLLTEATVELTQSSIGVPGESSKLEEKALKEVMLGEEVDSVKTTAPLVDSENREDDSSTVGRNDDKFLETKQEKELKERRLDIVKQTARTWTELGVYCRQEWSGVCRYQVVLSPEGEVIGCSPVNPDSVQLWEKLPFVRQELYNRGVSKKFLQGLREKSVPWRAAPDAAVVLDVLIALRANRSSITVRPWTTPTHILGDNLKGC